MTKIDANKRYCSISELDELSQTFFGGLVFSVKQLLWMSCLETRLNVSGVIAVHRSYCTASPSRPKTTPIGPCSTNVSMHFNSGLTCNSHGFIYEVTNDEHSLELLLILHWMYFYIFFLTEIKTCMVCLSSFFF